ncbi:uncharacterized protein [Dermacentor albipictus]|uniref:uncharacterized protein n=1 Tax=Dermacentor albipictus TaxID=60249 RepID=UPI0038FC38E2
MDGWKGLRKGDCGRIDIGLDTITYLVGSECCLSATTLNYRNLRSKGKLATRQTSSKGGIAVQLAVMVVAEFMHRNLATTFLADQSIQQRARTATSSSSCARLVVCTLHVSH